MDDKTASADLESFEARYAAAAPALRAWAALRCRGPLGAALDESDLVQEICVAALRAEVRFDPGRGPWRAWLFGIAHQVANDLLRRLARGRLAVDTLASREHRIPDSVTTISRRVRRDEALSEFLRRAEALAPEDRDLLVHRGLEGLEYADLAQILGLSPDAVAKRWQRLRARLQSSPAARSLLEGF